MNTPDHDEDLYLPKDSRFERILHMIAFVFLLGIAKPIFWAMVIAQFVWTLIYGTPNDHIAEFGARLGVWVKRVILYMSGTTDEKPFPWREID